MNANAISHLTHKLCPPTARSPRTPLLRVAADAAREAAIQLPEPQRPGVLEVQEPEAARGALGEVVLRLELPPARWETVEDKGDVSPKVCTTAAPFSSESPVLPGIAGPSAIFWLHRL